ncbi:MAG: transcription elongation factor GreA [Actinomycetota bacterium]|nr:transcription elongation factor GreA [Actinomycetota bacterium]
MIDKEIILTEEGFVKLKEELEYLTTKKRREVAQRIKEAIEFGDISENSEYDDAKNEQAFLEGRLQQITVTLNCARVIKAGEKSNEVTLGCKVVLRDLETDETVEHMLVGSAEADPFNNKISNESPVGLAIIGKKAGDKVMVNVPAGVLEYLVVDIKQ